MNYIKVLDPQKANRLKDLGFNYFIEVFNRQEIYVFEYTDELKKNIISFFDKGDFFIDKTLNF